jgi:hypothetical protein
MVTNVIAPLANSVIPGSGNILKTVAKTVSKHIDKVEAHIDKVVGHAQKFGDKLAKGEVV